MSYDDIKLNLKNAAEERFATGEPDPGILECLRRVDALRYIGHREGYVGVAAAVTELKSIAFVSYSKTRSQAANLINSTLANCRDFERVAPGLYHYIGGEVALPA